MALRETPEVELGAKAPDFKLKDISGKEYDLNQCRGKNGLLVMFICNHCPYVKAVQSRLPHTVEQLKKLDIGVVAIMSNNYHEYPEDAPAKLVMQAQQFGFNFPYLIDENAKVARDYDAVCTPDFFGFNKNLELQYRGRLDSARNQPVDENTVPELLNAMREIAETGFGPEDQFPSMGCNIKF